jgi:hypothetical protein
MHDMNQSLFYTPNSQMRGGSPTPSQSHRSIERKYISNDSSSVSQAMRWVTSESKSLRKSTVQHKKIDLTYVKPTQVDEDYLVMAGDLEFVQPAGVTSHPLSARNMNGQRNS